MKNILNYSSFLNENNSNNITSSNFLEFKNKVQAVVADQNDETLKKGYQFTIDNINDYNSDDFVSKMIDLFFDKINSVITKKYPSFWFDEDTGYSGNKSIGNKYKLTKNLSMKEISSLIKKELVIEFPEWKFSVKLTTYSGGCSIDATIVDMPYNPYSEDADEAFKQNKRFEHRYNKELYNEQYLKDKEKIENVLNQYNYNDSDAQIDYFDKRYYSHLNIDDFSIKSKYYSDSEEVKRRKQWDEEYKIKKQKQKEIADSRKGNYKKGEEIIFTFEKDNGRIPKGSYKAIILKAPNGRARILSTYEIRVWVDKIIKNGEITSLEKPHTYVLTEYSEKNFKKI